MTLINISDLSIAFGDHKLLDRVNMTIDAKQKIGLIGRNGEGKSTLLNILAKTINEDEGEIRTAPGINIALLDQAPKSSGNLNVFDAVAYGIGEVGQWLSEHRNISEQADLNASLLYRLGELQQKIESQGGWSIQSRVEKVLGRLQLRADQNISELSGGWQRRVALARTLVSDPQVLLLDEPTNHLDVEAILWLEKQIGKFPGAVIFVTHDRTFLQNIATDIVELDRGKLVLWPGNYSDYLARKSAWLAQEERQNAEFNKKLAREEVWIRQGIKARRTRNEGRVRALKKMREERFNRRNPQAKANINLNLEKSSGKIAIECEDIGFSFEDQEIVKNFSTRIIRGDRVGLIGPNGIGKTTLLKLLLKEIEPSTGMVKHGTRLDVAYFDQLRSQLDLDKTVIDVIGEGREQITINGKPKHVISYLSDFLFTPARSRSPIKSLSGGERARVLLARLFSKSANMLVMDEPTNDLDIETLELLEDLLIHYSGTLLLVSHDRKFLDNVVTSTIAFEGNGKVKEYVGGYSDWLRQTKVSSTESDINTLVKVERKQKLKSNKSKKLTFTDQQELERLPKIIEDLEFQQSELTAAISNASFYDQPSQLVNETLEQLKAIDAQLDQNYRRWSDLES